MEDIKRRLEIILKKIDTDGERKKIREIEAESAEPSFWKDHNYASSKMKELSDLQKELEELDQVEELIRDGKEKEAEDIISRLENLLYFSHPYDQGPAILSIHSGQGGVEAMDWAEMLFRMYTRFFEKKGWRYEVIEEIAGEEAGVKSVVIVVSGKYVYGFLKGEAGTHRLVRQSPFNADNLRQTSFALVEVLPEIEESSEIDIKEDDLDWEFYRASSHGGQNVQKVSSAVRLKHKPTGIVVTAQKERYQGQNRENALKILRARLWLMQEEKIKKQEQELKGGYKTPGWGNQIRSYVLHPYHMVKDLRTGFETSDTQGVLDGNIDQFIEEELKKI
ncbi:MAG: peptide chain release factor 2 [Patescibacteria group bacterium]|nr:peptide chain release factor 2 [Patescibacteria group bacterium]